jgi:hypothetical protein
VQTLYAVINNRGIQQIFTPIVWKLSVPSRLHILLWLLVNNKILTRDNLAKRRNVEDKSCLFCAENQSVTHFFYECCVARNMWMEVAKYLTEQLLWILNPWPDCGLEIPS